MDNMTFIAEYLIKNDGEVFGDTLSDGGNNETD